MRYIQQLIGHKSRKTTEIYAHVSITGLKEISNHPSTICEKIFYL
ncbi:hypothetical protein [Williamwhitmania taraxaci]